jgi:crotonobetainyl-CoA:carnitine CoA-transferase CaiB-like acyl-CoA transferase
MAHPKAGDVRTLGNPIKLSRTPTVEPVAAPTLGQHSKAILGELGFSESETEKLIGEGTVGA